MVREGDARRSSRRFREARRTRTRRNGSKGLEQEGSEVGEQEGRSVRSWLGAKRAGGCVLGATEEML
jgi:hypothetical protein